MMSKVLKQGLLHMVHRDKLPREFTIESGDKTTNIRKMIADELSLFNGKIMKDVFLYSVAVGFKLGKREKLQKKTGGAVVPISAFSVEELSLLKTIAINEKQNIDILLEKNVKEFADIIEEYANGGFNIVFHQVYTEEPGDVDKRLEQDLRDLLAKQDYEPRSPMPLKTDSDYLQFFETRMRSFISSELEKTYGEKWWERGVPPDISLSCSEKKIRRDQMPWIEGDDPHLIQFVDFTDYYKIIIRKDNWKNIFSKYFNNTSWVETKLTLELTPIRNELVHTRTLSDENSQKFRLAVKDILRCIDAKVFKIS
jgi:dnd system-associated protein 4